jgi:hypothetical protein
MLARYPDLKGQFAWGGAFGASASNSAADLMHFDIGGQRGDPSRYLTKLGPIPGETYGGKQPQGPSLTPSPPSQVQQPPAPQPWSTQRPQASWPTAKLPSIPYTASGSYHNPFEQTRVDNRSDLDVAQAKTTSDNDDGEPVPLPLDDPRDKVGDAQIPKHLNPTAKLGAEVTRKYITPMDKARFGKLYGETTWVRGEGPGRLFEEGHPAIEYNTEEQKYDPLASQQTMKHELEHAGVMESLTYQEHWQENSEFQLAGGEELRQRLSDVERIQAYGPSAMKQGTYRAQLKDAHTMIARLTTSLSEKLHMTPDEVRAKVKSYQADIDQAVKKREEKRQQENKSGPVKPPVDPVKPPVNPVGQSADSVDTPAELEPAQ